MLFGPDEGEHVKGFKIEWFAEGRKRLMGNSTAAAAASYTLCKLMQQCSQGPEIVREIALALAI